MRRLLSLLALLLALPATAQVSAARGGRQTVVPIVPDLRTLGAGGNGTTDDTAKIQAAIDATPDGGTLLVPSGNYLVCSGLPLRITKSLRLRGVGAMRAPFTPGASVFKVCGSASATTDVFLVQPPFADGYDYEFSDLAIIPVAGPPPARHAIHFDGTNGEVRLALIRRVEIWQLGGAAIRGDGSGLAQGTPVVTNIEQSWLLGSTTFGAISLPNAGDTVRIRDNVIAAQGPGLDVSFQPGSAMLIVSGNNITSDGGIHIGTAAIAAQIVENEIESLGTFTGSNSSLLDIDGTTGSHATDVVVSRNSFQVVNGITANGIRVNFADRTYIVGNRFGRGATTSKDILVTANASDTTIGHNNWINGSPYTSMISDAGTRTLAAFVYPTSGVFTVPNAKVYGSIDEAGTVRKLMTMGADGSVVHYGYHDNLMAQAVNGATYLYDGAGGATPVLAASVLGVAASSMSGTATVGSLAVKNSTGAGTITLSGGTGTATVYTGARCVCSDTTANASCRTSVSSTTLTVTGTGTDVVNYLCF